MKHSSYATLLLLTLALLAAACSGGGDTATTAAGGEEAPAKAAAEPAAEPAKKPSEVLVGTWAATPEGLEAMKEDAKLKALMEEVQAGDKAAAFQVMMEIMGFSAVQWTFNSDGTVNSQVADFILAAEEAAGQKVRDDSGQLVNKTYRDMANSGTWSTDSETGDEITITIKDLGKDSQQFSFRVADNDTLHALIADKRYPFPLSRLK